MESGPCGVHNTVASIVTHERVCGGTPKLMAASDGTRGKEIDFDSTNHPGCLTSGLNPCAGFQRDTGDDFHLNRLSDAHDKRFCQHRSVPCDNSAGYAVSDNVPDSPAPTDEHHQRPRGCIGTLSEFLEVCAMKSGMHNIGNTGIWLGDFAAGAPPQVWEHIDAVLNCGHRQHEW